MSHKMQRIDEKLLKSQLVAAYEYLLAENDTVNAAKVKELAAKLVRKEFTIAFCGHFSAGKSTMINRLIGENLLPSSPIPTSANLVKVKAGADYAKVIFKNAKPRKYLAPYDYKMVKNYCKDGDAIESIEISHADSTLPSNTIIMDTPGIDSADDAHRLATESALHQADLILYVMDYNHVQSELNFMFTKELTEAGKEVYLVINQVDKHSDSELSFAKFRTGVADSFASWGVRPARVFYTSLKNQSHEHNQFPQLQLFIQERLNNRGELLLNSLFISLKRILSEHSHYLKAKMTEETAAAKKVLADLSADQLEDMLNEYKELNTERRAIAAGLKPAELEFDDGIRKILDNAYLMPFQTRDLAEKYLAASQPNFKVGWLFSQRKTEEERKKRLHDFLIEINEKAKSQVEWHMRDFLGRFLRDKHINNDELAAAVQSLQVDCTESVLTGALKEGASLSGDYVLNYTNDVANEIKLLAKRRTAALKDAVLKELAARYEVRRRKLVDKLAGMENYIAAFDKLAAVEAAEKQARIKAAELLENSNVSLEAQQNHLFNVTEVECEIIAGSSNTVKMQTGDNKAKELAVQTAVAANSELAVLPKAAADSIDKMKDAAARLCRAAELTASLPGFKKLAGELTDKAARLSSRGFTVALFGAFSAGKSSFANALIGGRILPVSPNPMTAAINRIKPVDSEHEHGLVVIKIKTAAALLEDINNALKNFSTRVESLDDVGACIERLDEAAGLKNAAVKTNYAFLQAFKRGYSSFADNMGATITTVISEFGDYVALEEKSCFVEWIDLYYDCPLTRQGITLVDTPGADSINARHTGVAFEYIKNSDAILFVTYYNHAFSKADREFLIQLGRVKDSFQLDKMFFIINAIDLADNDEEKQTVIDYVGEQLVKYGVRQPQLYSLSSLNALQEKLGGQLLNSGLAEFETSFYRFITHDLAGIAVVAAENEFNRVQGLLASLIASSQADADVKAARRQAFAVEQAAAVKLLDGQSPQLVRKRVTQEVQELVYYIRQRVFFRFNEFFREAFNPGVLRDDGRNLKQALQESLAELLAEIGFDFAQEMRATTVRLDRFIERQLRECQRELSGQLREINRNVSFAEFELSEGGNLDFTAAFADVDRNIFVKPLSGFKNPKDFFENGGNKLMREAVYKLLEKPADVYLAAERQRLIDGYSEFAAAQFNRLQEQLKGELADFYLGQFAALDSGLDDDKLQRIAAELASL